MRSLLALGLLTILCGSASGASGIKAYSARHSMQYPRYHGSYDRYFGGYSRNYGGLGRYYGSPNDRGGLVGGSDNGT